MMLPRKYRSDIVTHITTDNSLAMERLTKYTNFFIAKGSSRFAAHKQALQSMENIVVKQSSQLSFSDSFLIVGLVFLVALPVLLLVVKRRGEKLRVILADH